MNSGTVLPILSLGYNIIQLEGIDNKQLFKDIIENKDKKNDPNYKEIVFHFFFRILLVKLSIPPKTAINEPNQIQGVKGL